MKVEIKKTLMTLLLFVGSFAALSAAEPQTTELRAPKAIEIVHPQVPSKFARTEVPGRVDVSFKLNKDGYPKDIRVEDASHSEYAESVVNALRQWRFEGESAANVRYRLPVLFN